MFEQDLAISQRLAEQDPSNAGWQRDLAVAYWWNVDLRKKTGKPEAALVLYEEAAYIFRELAENAPGFSQWNSDKEAIESELALCRLSIEQSTHNHT